MTSRKYSVTILVEILYARRETILKILICDDDLIYTNEIKNNVERILQNRYISATFCLFNSSVDVIAAPDSYDIALLDIQMPTYSGIEVAEKLKEHNPNIIIFFITSYDQYLDEAMDLNAFRYIKKPLDVKRLQSGIEKAISHIDNSTISFHLKNGSETQTVISSEIIYIEIVGNYTKVVTTKQEYVSNKSISFWRKKLISTSFFPVHKSFIINMKYISGYKRDTVTLCEKHQIPVAYRKQAEFRSFFFDYFGG